MPSPIAKAVRNERKARNLTQQELGELAGAGLNFVSQLERGKETVRLDKLLDVLKVLGLELVVSRRHNKLSLSQELR
jgi:y4mF family transcriptional regulator